jgi:hypothetical protein
MQNVHLDRMDEIASQHGYPNDIHLFQAPDGFILSLFRMESPNEASQPASRGPLFMINGFNMDATYYLVTSDTSPAYQFADEGYEVWIMNPRASRTSRAHVERSPDGNPETCIETDPFSNPCQLGVLNTHEYFNLTYETYAQDVMQFYQYISEQTGYSSFPAYCQANGCSYLAASMSSYPGFFNDAVSVAIMTDPFIEKGNTETPFMLQFVVMLPLFSLLDNLGFGLIVDTNVLHSLYEPF